MNGSLLSIMLTLARVGPYVHDLFATEPTGVVLSYLRVNCPRCFWVQTCLSYLLRTVGIQEVHSGSIGLKCSQEQVMKAGSSSNVRR